ISRLLATPGLFLLRTFVNAQVEHCGVHAIALASWSGAVVEDVAEMRLAARAEYFGARHAVRAVGVLGDGALCNRRVEAGPARPGIEFGFRVEQILSADGAAVDAGAVFVPVLSGEGAL